MGRAMVWLLAAAWSVAVVLPAAADRATQIHTIEVGGLTRTYLLHVPPSLPAGLSPRIAAIAPVVGGIADPPDAWPVSVLILQGTTDPLVPYRGGAIAFGRGRIIDTEEAARRWARLDGTAPEPRSTVLPAPGKDHCGGLRLTYSGGRDGSEGVLVRLHRRGHTRPRGPPDPPEGRIRPVRR